MLIRAFTIPSPEPGAGMKRRLTTSGKTSRARRRKTPNPKRGVAVAGARHARTTNADLKARLDQRTNELSEARKLLEKAIYKSQQPGLARFYLGRVERILGRDKEALRHFNAVLDVEPNHRDASAEVRVIEARLRRLANNSN